MERKSYSNVEELCEWLDGNSAGSYYPSAIAARKIEDLLTRVEELEEDGEFLICLENAGVDGWEGYEAAQEMMED